MRHSPSNDSPHLKRFESYNECSTVVSSIKRVKTSEWRKGSPKKTLLN